MNEIVSLAENHGFVATKFAPGEMGDAKREVIIQILTDKATMNLTMRQFWILVRAVLGSML
jgi:hypothetical protein